MLPEVWMISISDCEVSQYYRQICQPSWEQQGFQVHHFEAITPKDVDIINSGVLRFGRKNPTKYRTQCDFSETEKAIWYSHYYLWQHCSTSRARPIIIIEQDMYFKEMPGLLSSNSIPYGVMYACLGTAYYDMIRKFTPQVAGAYYLHPNFAYELHRSTSSGRLIQSNVDGWMMNYGKRVYRKYNKSGAKIFDKEYSKTSQHIYEPEIGATIKHIYSDDEELQEVYEMLTSYKERSESEILLIGQACLKYPKLNELVKRLHPDITKLCSERLGIKLPK